MRHLIVLMAVSEISLEFLKLMCSMTIGREASTYGKKAVLVELAMLNNVWKASIFCSKAAVLSWSVLRPPKSPKSKLTLAIFVLS